jgi:IS30 family transposase
MDKFLELAPRPKIAGMSHLTLEQRYKIEAFIQVGKNQTEIAHLLHLSKSVISREISRNRDKRNGVYKASLAQKKYQERLLIKPKFIKATDEVCNEIKRLIQEDYSPEQVSGFMKKQDLTTMSTEWIYQFVWKDKRKNGELYKHLRRKGRRYRKRGASKDKRGEIKGRIGIEHRTKEADLLTHFGHLELDTIIGKNHQGAIITLNDKTSGMLWMRKVETKEANIVRLKLEEMLDEIKPFLRTITADNGKEFSEHQYITDEYCDFYFADPYSPWQRGANENLNGLIRQYIPKSADFATFSDKQIQEINSKINNRPRKRFNYENPIFVMEKLLFNQKVAFVT